MISLTGARIGSQLVNSASNALLMFLLAGVLAVEDFAAASVGYLWALSLSGFVRSLVGDGVQLGSIDVGLPCRADLLRLWGAITMLCWGGLSGLALWLAIPGALAVALAAAACVTVAAELLRSLALPGERAWRVLFADLGWLALQLVALLAVESSNAVWPIVSWAAGASVVVVVLAPAGAWSRAGSSIRWRSVVRARSASAVDFVVVLVGSLLSIAWLASLAPLVAAQTRAAMTLLAPIDTVTAGLRLTFLSRLKDTGLGQYQATVIVTSILGALAAYLSVAVGSELVDVSLLELAGPAVLPLASLSLLRGLARPIIDRALARRDGIQTGLFAGRLTGELVCIAVLAIAGTSASVLTYAGARSVSPILAAAGSADLRKPAATAVMGERCTS